MNEEEIKDLIETLDEVGHSRNLRMVISVGVDPNEFLLTNISDFLASRREEIMGKGVEIEFRSTLSHVISSSGSMDSNKHIIILSGLSWKVREVHDEILKWAWVNPDKTFISSEDLFG